MGACLLLLAATLASLSASARASCVNVTGVENLVDLDTRTALWVANACSEPANSAQALLDLPGVKDRGGAWQVKAAVLSSAGRDCVDNAGSPADALSCVRSADKDTPQLANNTVSADLPVSIARAYVTVSPLFYPNRLRLVAPGRTKDGTVCTLINIGASHVTVTGLELDVARCASAQVNALFSQTFLTQAALTITGPSLANISVSDTRVTGGQWAAVIAPTADNDLRKTTAVAETRANNIALQITHVGSGGVLPPGVVMAAAIGSLDLTLLKDSNGVLTTYAVLLYKTYPGPLSDDIVVRPSAVRVLDVSAYAYVPRLSAELPDLLALWKCTDAFYAWAKDDVSEYHIVDAHATASNSLATANMVTAGMLILAVFMLCMTLFMHGFISHTKQTKKDK